ncbi:hypothetical protein [Streptomyces nodosus]|uniref:Uncharacterized protein n=1 Tax=Streptomyces nodosus TaxID=40318 RepID=A0A0B5D6M6_9ACTN|nr:hypothetical protein [Streptomyces nodosus]AJE38898.1 hypothetical protein SNOD_01600 [Streptomyces nodosus]MBB4789708.1 uncharacterized protein YihD (DUF1040 family) [Streptomyces nodosus]QEV37480.1 hypothetical protein CP978_01970 [Streptomyces nodosus]
MLRQEAVGEGSRLTDRQVLQRLADEAGFEAVSLPTTHDYVCKRRPQIQAEPAWKLQRVDDHDLGL